MAGPGNILIKVGADAGQAVAEFGKVNKVMGESMTTTEKMGAGMKKAALPAAAALGAIGVAAIGATKAAMEDATAQEHLAGVLQRTTGATEAQVKATEAWIAKVSKQTGVADDQLRPAMEKLVTATGDVGKSQKLMQKALDISAASGKDVETVTTAMAKGYQGQTAALTKLVPGLSAASRESKDFSTIMGELGDKTGGAMAKQTETATGQMAIMTNQVNELQESLGMALIPVVEAVIPLLSKLADFATKNQTAIKVLVGVVAGLSAAILVANAAMKAYQAAVVLVRVATTAWTVAQRLLNFALSANPIGLIITALALLAAGLVLAYQRSATFRAVVQGAMAGVKTAVEAVKNAFLGLFTMAQNVFAWIRDHWKLGLFAFGPLGAAVYLITTNFGTLKDTATKAANAIHDAIRKIGDAIAYVIDKIKDLIAWVGKIHIPHFDLPGPIGLAASAPATSRAATGPGRAAAPVTVNVFGAVDPEGTARAIERTLRARTRRTGYQYRTTAY